MKSNIHKLEGFHSESLHRALLRNETFGGILYVPRLNTQLVVNADLCHLLISIFCNPKTKKQVDELGGYNSSLVEKMILDGLSKKSWINSEKVGRTNLQVRDLRLSAPIQVILEITQRCNQFCSFCYAADGMKKGNELPTQKFLEILDESAKLGVFRIHFMGGEPLVREDFEEIISYADSLGLYVSFTTNGVLLDRVIPTLRGLSYLLPVQVSLHSTHPDVYERYGIPSQNQENTKRNCFVLRENGIQFGIKSVISIHNYSEIYDLASMAAELGAESVTFLNLLPLGRGSDKVEEGNLRNDYLERIMLDLERARELPIHVDYRPFINIYYPREPEGAVEEFVSCPSGNIDIRIRHDGAVIQCSSVREKLLDINSMSLKQIWEEFPKVKRPCPFLECSYFGEVH